MKASTRNTFLFSALATTAIAIALTNSEEPAQGGLTFTPETCSAALATVNDSMKPETVDLICSWYKTLPDTVRANLRADAAQNGLATETYLLDWYASNHHNHSASPGAAP